MTSKALFVALLGILACLADAQLRRSTKQGRALESLKFVAADPTFQLGKCEGDCDADSDCLDQLICFEKDAGGSGEVPGCDGTDTTRNDYCIDPADVGAPTGSPPTTPIAPSPTGSSPTAPTAPAPTGSSPTTHTSPAPPSNVLSDLGRLPPLDDFPLGLCQGDCDFDSDCATGLVCFDRWANSSPLVPSCIGSAAGETDFCVPADLFPSPPPPTSSVPFVVPNFKLKMYWETGYHWQQENFDRKWCLRCRSGSCNEGDQFYTATCSDDGVQQFDFDFVNSQQVMIRLHGTSLCLQREDTDNRVRNCDSGNTMQIWWTETGAFDDYRFQISPVSDTYWCVTQRHQPKADEEVHLEPCWLARRSQSAFWNRCYDDTC